MYSLDFSQGEFYSKIGIMGGRQGQSLISPCGIQFTFTEYYKAYGLSINEKKKAFTVLELLVAVSVTALLAGMLLNITSQETRRKRKHPVLETNQVAQFVLTHSEDLHVQFSRMMEMYGWLQIYLIHQVTVGTGVSEVTPSLSLLLNPYGLRLIIGHKTILRQPNKQINRGF